MSTNFERTLALALVLTCGASYAQAPRLAAARYLPGGRTLVAVDVAGWQDLLVSVTRIDQLAVMRQPAVRGLLRWIGEENPSFGRITSRAGQLESIGARFDRGLTATLVFEPRKNGQPHAYLVGAAKSARSLRGLDETLAALLARDGSKQKLVLEQTPIADSPVNLMAWAPELDLAANTWASYNALAFARKGRLAGFNLVSTWVNGPAEQWHERKRAQQLVIGDLIGLSPRQPAPRDLGPMPELPDGERMIARLRVFWRGITANDNYTREGDRKEMRQAGVLDFDGLQAFMIDDGKKIRERLELHCSKIEGPSLLTAVTHEGSCLGDVLAFLPDDALGAMHVAFSSEKVTAASYALFEMESENAADFFGPLRELFGLETLQGRPGLEGIGGLTLCVLPGATARLAPELCMLVPCDAKPDQAKKLIEGLARLMAGALRTEIPPVKKLGKTGDAVHYMGLKPLFAGAGAQEQAILVGVIGGGFVSATRIGPYLAVGFNPRTLRNAKRNVAAGKTLATNAAVAARFRKGKGAALEAWLDWPAIVAKLTVIDTIGPMMALFARRGASAKPAEMPKAKKLAPLFKQQWLWSEPADFGHVVHIEGSTMMSPTAWAAAGFMISWMDGLQRLLR